MVLYLLVFFSGFCALVYQVLWMKQLALLFGNTSQAAGVTLAAFFAGLAAGSWLWGKRSAINKNPLRVYAGLELAIAVTALLYFGVLQVYHGIYPWFYQSVHSDTWLLLIKFLLALILIFPPAFFMGGTIPVMGQQVIRVRSRFGSTSALLYGVNTLGATSGAFLAGFFMPIWFGFRGTCLIAMGITIVIAAIALVLSRSSSKIPEESPNQAGESTVYEHTEAPREGFDSNRFALGIICFLSGFGVLALEVLWTRMFALVLENSVYTFAAILVVVLACLSGGALLSSILARRAWPPQPVLAVLLTLSGLSIALTPMIFIDLTDSFQFQAAKMEWLNFVLFIFTKCGLTIGPPALVLGAVFPYLMKTEERYANSPGKTLGRLAMINTIGAILGSLICAFFLLGWLGLWRSMQVIGILYFLAAILMPSLRNRIGIATKAAGVGGLILLFTALNPSDLSPTAILDSRKNEKMLKSWEGSDCTVSVVKGDEGLSIKINSDYGLGSTGNWRRQAAQATIPLMLLPDAESVFFLGMGTGISAGAALSDDFPAVKRVVTCELSPHVIEAAKEFMTDVDGVDLTNGLFTDPRSTVLIEDGRHHLMATNEKFDLINGDLFVPYRSSTGSLYTKEHFESVKARLKSGGMFVQWLPAYQVTEFEFHVIGRTMLEVFDQVSLWRCDFEPFDEVVAFVGHEGGRALPPCNLDAGRAKMAFLRGETEGEIYKVLNPQTALVYYGGNVTASKDLFADYPVNTDDKPIIQYLAPRQYREKGAEAMPWFVGPYLMKFFKDLQENCPANEDPLLMNRTERNRRLPSAGNAYMEARLWARFGKDAESQKSWQRFVKEWLGQ